MAPQPFALAHQQPIAAGFRLAVAEAERAASRRQRQHPRHRMAAALAILQPLAQQQQAAAFRHDRQTGAGGLGQLAEAAPTGRQGFGMQFRVPPRQQHRSAVRWQGIVG